jgi:hypothetical protein
MTQPARAGSTTVRALGWTSFLTDLSSEAIYPLLPAFVKGLGGSAIDVGLLDGIANAVAAVVRLFAGGLSDRIGRRPLVLAGYGLSAVVRPLMGLVATPLAAVLVRTIDRFGKGIRSAPRDALVTDLVGPEARGRAFGHIRSMDHAGAAIGPLLAMLFLLAFPGCERVVSPPAGRGSRRFPGPRAAGLVRDQCHQEHHGVRRDGGAGSDGSGPARRHRMGPPAPSRVTARLPTHRSQATHSPQANAAGSGPGRARRQTSSASAAAPARGS